MTEYNFQHLQARLRAVQIQSDVVDVAALCSSLSGFPCPIIFWKSTFYTLPDTSLSQESQSLMVGEGIRSVAPAHGSNWGGVEVGVRDLQCENSFY